MGLLFRQKMRCAEFGIIRLPEVRTLDNGQSELFYRDQSEQIVPDPSTTDLKTLLDAGVDLKRVDSRVLGVHGSLTVDLGLEEPKQEETKTNDEGDK